eukprot:2073288-Ditylum_brightwellii.AAC.1
MDRVANLSTQLTNKDTEIAALCVSIENLNIILQQLTSARITTTSTPGVTGARKPRKKRGGVNISYRWTCGVTITHLGKDCCNKRAGHKDAATLSNIMGGNKQGIE